MAKKHTTLRIVIDKLMRHPMLQSITEESIVDYTVDFMQIVGVPSMFEEEEKEIHIKNNRGELPCNFIDILSVRDLKCNNLQPKHQDPCFVDNCSYQIKGNYIFTNTKESVLKIRYKAINMDEEGFPLIPDNPSFMRALEAYIKKQYFTILFDLGKLQGGILQNAQQEYAWAVGDCTNEFLRLSPEELEVELPKIKRLI